MKIQFTARKAKPWRLIDSRGCEVFRKSGPVAGETREEAIEVLLKDYETLSTALGEVYTIAESERKFNHSADSSKEVLREIAAKSKVVQPWW